MEMNTVPKSHPDKGKDNHAFLAEVGLNISMPDISYNFKGSIDVHSGGRTHQGIKYLENSSAVRVMFTSNFFQNRQHMFRFL